MTAPSPAADRSPTPTPPAPTTLCVDCGGGGLKAAVVDATGRLVAPAQRIPTPYPLTPQLLVHTVADLAARLPRARRVTIGMPGMIRRGVVIETPHYVCADGPSTARVPELVEQWHGCELERMVAERLDLPTLVLNDTEVAAAGVVSGTGTELVLTLGTGLGNALVADGCLAPHLELSRGPSPAAGIVDDHVGEVARRAVGDVAWSERVAELIRAWRPVFVWDHLHLGGGNAQRLRPSVLAGLGSEVSVVPNTAGLVGGVRAWELREGEGGRLRPAGTAWAQVSAEVARHPDALRDGRP